MKYQQTVRKMIECEGRGLHHGEKVKIKLFPAPADAGIVFIREFQNRSVYIDARIHNVFNTLLSTSLGVGSIHVHTVEHLMAACQGLEIDNLYVVMNSHEVPIMDGSASILASTIKKAGIAVHNQARKYIKIKEEIELNNKEQSIRILPSEVQSITYTMGFPHPMVDNQSFTFSQNTDDFYEDISKARTFCMFKDIENIKKMGLAKGGSLENAVVIGEKGILNEGGLRYPDEFARHKILDMIGDLSLIGMPLLGHITAHGSGHFLNIEFAKKILKNKNKWEVVTKLPTYQPELACV